MVPGHKNIADVASGWLHSKKIA